MTEMKRSGIEVGTANLYILDRRTWLRGSTSGTEITMKSPGGWVRIPWMFIAQSESGVQTMYLENCISETHQAVNHRKEKIYRFQKKSKK